jgi:benzodiazapine receptor
MSKDSGVQINARPPSYVFAVVWTILYILLGISWVHSRNCKCNNSKIVDTLYITLIALLNYWIVKYGCDKDPKSALFILPFTILLTLILIVYSLGTASSYLLLPLLVWLIYAMLLNYTEVNMMTPS